MNLGAGSIHGASVTRPIHIDTARPGERADAFRLAFQHLPPAEQEIRIANALDMVRRGEWDPAGILVARDSTTLQGVFLFLQAPGASALVWPPRTQARQPEKIEDDLIQHASAWLRERGAKLAQALLMPAEAHLGKSLLRNGFQAVTSLWYMRSKLDRLPDPSPESSLQLASYCQEPLLFQETLLGSYEATLDCPEVNGVRTIEEVLEGHRAQGVRGPEDWWLARQRIKPVGVLLLAEMPEGECWDVSYIGVLPAARRQGLGRQLLSLAIQQVKQRGGRQLTLSVDARNKPACNLYQDMGFEPYEVREVFLAIWPA